MSVTTISFFRFRGPWARLWALVSMQFAKGPLRRIPGIGFHKLMGTGAGEGFDLAPNFGVYVILATWPSEEAARVGIEESSIFEKYRRRSEESWTLYLETVRAKGSWDASQPFSEAAALPTQGDPAPRTPWVGVLTRATVRPNRLFAFWRSVPSISDMTTGQPGLHFKLGMGELPFIQLMTFSLWDETQRIQRFAYDPGPHREAMKLARRERWFQEELFARFRVLTASGTWGGTNPVIAPSQEEVGVT